MALVTKNFSDIITFTRASTGTFFNSAGVLTSAANDVPRFDYNPSTLAAQGLLIEESRTNSIRNNTMVGAVAGTPGTAPTNWAMTAAGGNITSREIVGIGTENGVTYIEVRYVFSGAATANVRHEQAGVVTAAVSQVWSATAYVKLVAGSLSNITTNQSITQYDSGFVGLEVSTTAFVPTAAALQTQRYSHIKTLNQATVASVASTVQIVASGAADVTFRIGLPQLELGAFATSVIPTTTTALTRSADVASVNTLSPWYNATEGTLFGQALSGPQNTGNQVVTTFTDGTISNRISIVRGGVDSSAGITLAGAATYTGSVVGNWPVNTSRKIAIAFSAGQQNMTANGTLGSPAGTSAIFTPSVLSIGARVDGAVPFNGHIQRLTYYPRRLSNAELQAITA